MSLSSKVKDIIDSHFENVRSTDSDNLKATCPFHTGKSGDRTFSISLKTGAWICFHSSCGARGSLPQLLKLLGMGPKQIDRVVQDLKPETGIKQHLKVKSELEYEPVVIPEFILGAYSELPESLLKKGFTEETLRHANIGIDKQRKRIVFPIRDYLGRLVAISGRAQEDWMIPRYKVYDAKSPRPGQAPGELHGIVEKYRPDNRRHIYGFHDVYPERFFKSEKDCPPLIITEGYKSTLWLRQLGFKDAVGLQGSSMSTPQKRLLQRLAGPHYIMLDNQPGKNFPDEKRRCAAVQIANELNKSGLAKICKYPEGKRNGCQPDELTKEEVEEMIKSSKTVTQFLLEWSK